MNAETKFFWVQLDPIDRLAAKSRCVRCVMCVTDADSRSRELAVQRSDCPGPKSKFVECPTTYNPTKFHGRITETVGLVGREPPISSVKGSE